MNCTIFARVVLALGGVAAAIRGLADERPTASAAVADFLLAAADGSRVHLVAEDPARRFTVLWFAALDCAATRTLAPAMAELARTRAASGVRFLAIDPAAGDAAEAALAFSRKEALGFPWLLDPRQVVSARLGVATTATALLLDAGFVELARLELAVDDGAAGSSPSVAPLADAIAAALAGKPAGPRSDRAAGVPLAKLRPAVPAAPTFHRDIAPILWRHCVECHHPGDIGPMSFLDAEESRGWAPQIVEEVDSFRMPPWNADPRIGHFSNERSLTETEKQVLRDWNASGAALGDARDAPPPPVFDTAEWSIGKPDVVVELPAPQKVPAEGVVSYRYVPVDPRFTEDHYVQAAEVRPSNRTVTHHVGVFLLPPGQTQPLLNPNQLFAGTSPGSRPIQLPDGMAKKVPRGSRFLFQIHYTPNGKATTDRTRMALRFARAPVKREVVNWTVNNPNVNLPPHMPARVLQRSEACSEPLLVTALAPHMHLRGMSFRVELARSSGERRVLLDVPRYNFNWQHTYQLVDPVLLAANDSLVISAVYDNSAANPHNPDPSQPVVDGEQTTDEMMLVHAACVKMK